MRNALEGCTVDRTADGLVEIVEATPAHRAFKARITSSLGLCWKTGAAHEVDTHGKRVTFDASAICVRPPDCVWATAGTGEVGFVSIDIAPSLLPESSVGRDMTFVRADRLPDPATILARLRAGDPDVVTEVIVALGLPSDQLMEDLPRGYARRAREALIADLREPPSMTKLAASLGTNRFALTRAFKRELSITPRAYVLAVRVEAARERLVRGEDVTRIALELGFADQPHLTRVFKRVVGITPGEYARSIRSRMFKADPT